MLYPVSLDVTDRSVLVVGAGRVAKGKVDGLLRCGALVTVIAPEISPEVAGQALAHIEQRAYLDGDVIGFSLVFAATNDPDVNGRVSADAQAAGIWVNSADDPARCSFQLPALVRRDPVVVAVSSSGRSPALARWLRDRIAADLGPDIEWLAEQLAARRDELHRLGQSTEGLDWAGEIDRLRATRAC